MLLLLLPADDSDDDDDDDDDDNHDHDHDEEDDIINDVLKADLFWIQFKFSRISCKVPFKVLQVEVFISRTCVN